MLTDNKTKGVVLGLLMVVLGGGATFLVWYNNDQLSPVAVPVYSSLGVLAADGRFASSTPKIPEVTHLPTPKPLMAIYMTSCVAGTPSFRAKVVKLVKETKLNAIVVDLKDYTGALSFKPTDPSLEPFAISKCPLGDLKQLAEDLHKDGIYLIGRVTVFQDPLFAKKNPSEAVKKASDKNVLWPDKKGINYIDPSSKLAWDHIVAIAVDAHALGVDEINFDYIRFPSDGNMSDIYFPLSQDKNKADVMEGFFSYLNQQLKPKGIVLSADVFGLVATTFVDVGIGQVLERFLPHFDYISPMVYPSHYYNGYSGFTNPNEHPYEIVNNAMKVAIQRAVATTTTVKTFAGQPIASTTPPLFTKKVFSQDKIRPWLQDFDYPVHYTPAMVEAQIKATHDAGLDSFMMWDPSNIYTRSVYDAL